VTLFVMKLLPLHRYPSLPIHVAGVSIGVAGLGMLMGGLIEMFTSGPDMWALFACGVPSFALGLAIWASTQAPSQSPGSRCVCHRHLGLGVSRRGRELFPIWPQVDSRPSISLFSNRFPGSPPPGQPCCHRFLRPHRALLMYRAITQWLGGMGVIVLVIAVLPTVGSGAMSLMQAESPGPSGERLTPRVRQTARNLWLVYMGFTVLVLIAYLLAGMSLYDGFAHTFTTVSTGGFSPHNASLRHFDSAAIEWIAIVAMFLAGGSFALYYRAVRGNLKPLVRSTELHVYALVVLGASALMFLMADSDTAASEHLRDSLFAVTSVISTTGFTTADFGLWSQGTQVILMLLLPFGAMAGSTAGGVKFVRLIAVASYAHRAALRQLHPNLVRPVRVGNRAMPEEVAHRIVGFMVMALAIFGGGAVLIALSGADMITAFSAAASSFGNVGPGPRIEIGPIR
jgi:trk system potassium uptake protein